MSDLWDVGLVTPFLEFRTYDTFFKVSDFWDVGLIGIPKFGYFKNEFSFVGLLGCRTCGMSDLWDVGLVGGHPFTYL